MGKTELISIFELQPCASLVQALILHTLAFFLHSPSSCMASFSLFLQHYVIRVLENTTFYVYL